MELFVRVFDRLTGDSVPDSADKLSFQERFGLVVDREFTNRQQRRLTRRLTAAKLREQACIEDIDYRYPRGLDRSVIQRLSTCKWINNHDNVLIIELKGQQSMRDPHTDESKTKSNGK